MKKGFTLIELLVVVLIIGILAAVALPQYTKAVNKSRVATLEPILKSMVQAGEAFKLEQGVKSFYHSSDLELLSIELPSNISMGQWSCIPNTIIMINSKDSRNESMIAGITCNSDALMFGLSDAGVMYCGGTTAEDNCPQYGFNNSVVSSLISSTLTGNKYTR